MRLRKKYGISLELFTGRMAVAQEKETDVEQKLESYVTDATDSGGINVLSLKKKGYLTRVAGDLPVLKEREKFPQPVTEDVEQEMLNILEIYTFLAINTDLVKSGRNQSRGMTCWILSEGKIFLTHPMYTTAPEEQLLAFTKTKILNEDYFVKLYEMLPSVGPGWQ